MIRILTLVSAAVMLAACGSDEPEQTGQGVSETAPAEVASTTFEPLDMATLNEDAKAAVMAMGSSLKSQLQSAIQSGGPAQAVDVCHKIAPAVAESMSEEHGITLTRVSLKNRNPTMGVPNDWQTRVLQEFEARKAAGESPKTLVYSEVVGDEHRFMKAIPTEAVCLNCHGVDIKPEVQAKIDEFYPDDRAVGFEEGDLRGAFVAVRSLTAEP